MNNHEHGDTPPGYKGRLEFLLTKLQEHTQGIDALKAARRRTWAEVTDSIREFGVPEEAKFAVAAFAGYPTDPEKNRAYIETLRKIDEDAKASAGQVTAWLTSEEEAISTSFNPSIEPPTRMRYYFHVGILPQDAKLIVEQLGMLRVPIERSVRIPIIDDHFDRPLSLENEIRPYNAFDRDLAVVVDQPTMEVWRWDKDAPFPVVFGEDAVEELFNQHNLEEDSEIVKALETLTATLF